MKILKKMSFMALGLLLSAPLAQAVVEKGTMREHYARTMNTGDRVYLDVMPTPEQQKKFNDIVDKINKEARSWASIKPYPYRKRLNEELKLAGLLNSIDPKIMFESYDRTHRGHVHTAITPEPTMKIQPHEIHSISTGATAKQHQSVIVHPGTTEPIATKGTQAMVGYQAGTNAEIGYPAEEGTQAEVGYQAEPSAQNHINLANTLLELRRNKSSGQAPVAGKRAQVGEYRFDKNHVYPAGYQFNKDEIDDLRRLAYANSPELADSLKDLSDDEFLDMYKMQKMIETRE